MNNMFEKVETFKCLNVILEKHKLGQHAKIRQSCRKSYCLKNYCSEFILKALYFTSSTQIAISNSMLGRCITKFILSTEHFNNTASFYIRYQVWKMFSYKVVIQVLWTFNNIRSESRRLFSLPKATRSIVMKYYR